MLYEIALTSNKNNIADMPYLVRKTVIKRKWVKLIFVKNQTLLPSGKI